MGGLCWCIETSGEGVDVDILFTENSTIGQKIKLSESIVAAVRQMECPFSLQAHQIQGSDWNTCHPVIVWLVKKFFETREQTKEILRDHSHMQFGKAYDLPEEAAKAAPSAGFLADVGARYAAERRFRKARGEGADANDEVVRVQSCLFEYGERVGEAVPEGGQEAAAAAGMGSGLAAVAAAGLGEGAGAKDADGRGEIGAAHRRRPRREAELRAERGRLRRRPLRLLGTWCASVQPCACPRTRTCLAARAPLLPAAQLPRRAMAATAVPAPPPGHLLTDAHASAVARAQHGAQPMCTPRAPARPARRAHSAPRLHRPPAGQHTKPTLDDCVFTLS